MSTKNPPKGGKKCTNFEPQLFRRSLCKNCFKTEAEHRQDSKSPDVGRKEPELSAERPANVKDENDVKVDEEKLSEDGRSTKSEVKGQGLGVKTSSANAIRSVSQKALTGLDSDRRVSATDKTSAQQQAAVRQTELSVRIGEVSQPGTNTAAAAAATTRGHTKADDGRPDTRQPTPSGGGVRDARHSKEVSQPPETGSADVRGLALGTETGSAANSSPTPPHQSGATESGRRAASCGASGSVRLDPDGTQTPGTQPPEALAASGSLPSASYTAGVHYLENRNAAIREASVQQDAAFENSTAAVLPGASTASCLKQQDTNSSSESRTIDVVSGSGSPGEEAIVHHSGQGQAIPAGLVIEGRCRDPVERATGEISAKHLDSAGSVVASSPSSSYSGSSSSPAGVSQQASSSTGKTRTRRTRGNADHLVQDPSGITILYPSTVELTSGSSNAATSKYGITDIDTGSAPGKQAALIIIPSENNANKSATSSTLPYPQETRHVAYHKPTAQPDNDHSTYGASVTSSPQSASKTLSADTLRAISGSSLYYYPESDQANQRQQIIYNSNTKTGNTTTTNTDWYYNSNIVPTRSQTDEDNDVITTTSTPTNGGVGNRGSYFVRRRRRRPSVDESAWQAARQRRMASGAGDMANMARDEAMMEGTRMLIDSLREKIVILEARTEKIEREKEALSNLLSTKKEEYVNMEDDLKFRIEELEEQVNRLTNEKIRLLDRLKLPESERSSLRVQETEINELRKKMEETNQRYSELLEENEQLKQECRDLQLEMEEMHDQFREDEALEFREIQKELEATAKNCRILQFKLRKAERRNDQLEADRIHYEEKIRQLEAHFDDKQHIREMEEELKMAKEVSVRLHDELEFVEEKRQRYEEELDRMNDILTESESRRHALQKEVDTLTAEMGKLREELRRSNAVGPMGAVKQGQSREGEYDLAQLMRDLSDSLERENDLKEQLKYAEEETRLMRKKLSDMEEENESLNLQLQKLSSAKSGKFLRKKEPGEKEIVTEREHELRLEMELAEQEIKVLRRKLDDLEEDNELLMKQIKEIQKLIEGDDRKSRDEEDEEDDRPYDEKIRQMAKDIEVLKLKLIAKDQEAASKMRSSSVRGMLKKSRSLEEYREKSPSMSPVREFHQDIKRQLDFVHQEAGVLKEKLAHLEKENERLTAENRKLELLAGRSGLSTASVDDSVIENLDLRERLASLQSENSELREQIRLLDERTNRLSREALQTKRSADVWDESSESSELRKQLHSVQDECKALRKRLSELESQNSKLTRELSRQKGDMKKSNDFKKLEQYTTEELKNRVWELENEVKNLMTVIKNNEEETSRLEDEIDGYRSDIDKMLDAFRTREKELTEEIDNIQQRNEVLSNLLDLVTERADSTGKQLDKYQKEMTSKREGDSDVTKGEEKTAKDIEWNADIQEKFQSRIENLEAMLQEERLKVQAAEKKLAMKDNPLTSVADDNKLKEREKEILQQELSLCQKQLKSANEQIRSLKERLSKEQEAYESFKEENEKLMKQLEAEKKKAETAADTKKPASWRWEKQELEKQIKELKKKLDDMHEELKRQQFKWKLAGDDLARENKLKEKLEKQLQNIRDECDSVKKELEETKTKLEEVTKTLEKKEKQWTKEREALESDKMAAEQDAKDKADVIRRKDDIIKNKDKLIQEKDKSLKEREDMLSKKEELLKQKEAEIQMKNNAIKHKEDELKEMRKKYEAIEVAMKEKEERLKKLDEDIRRRDDRLKEKDEILERINRKLVEKQNEVSDMDKAIRQAMSKLDEREAEIKKMKTVAENGNREMAALEDKVKELRSELDKQTKEFERKLSTVTKQKDKVESELSTLQKEKKALLNDLQDAKEKLNKEQEKWRREKNKLELELNQKTEKLRSLDANRGLKQSEVVKNLSSEKEKLITEKHKLADDINRLKKELKENLKQWNSEREDLQKIIAEKTKMIEDNQAITERMQKDIDALRKGQASSADEQKLVPIPVKHEVSSHRIPVIHQTPEEAKIQTELKAKLEEQEILMEADKEGLKELYEGRLSNLTEELSVAHDKVSTLKEENDKQLELLQSSRKALAELRNRYDKGLNSWNEERERLEKKAKEAEERKVKLDELQKVLEETKEKLKLAESKCQESEKRLNTEKKVWAAEKASLQNKLKQYEESPPGGANVPTARRDSKVSEFRAKFDKFEKFGGMQGGATGLKKTTTPSGGANVDTKSAEVDKTVKEAQKAIKDLQSLMKEVEASRQTDKKEFLSKIDKERKEWDKERNELKQRTVKLEARSKELSDQEKLLVELQCKLQDERATWQTEKKQLQETLDETKEVQLREKAKVTELLSEVKRLQALIKSLQEKEADSALEARVRGSRRSRTPSEERPTFTTVKVIGSDEPEEVKRALDKSLCEIITKALEHISKLAEELKNPAAVSERRRKTLAPAVFRRSLSTSEVEMAADRESYVYNPQTEAVLVPSYSVSQTSAAPSTYNSSSLDRPSRSRRPRHSALEPEASAIQSGVSERRSFRSVSNRNSIYASGTQSAYTSRDSSPEKVKKRSPYPVAPPSMIITPSHTPRRAPSAERDGRSFSSRDMAMLYAKLSSIETAQEEQDKALLKERGRGIRILKKSTSVDHADDVSKKLRLQSEYTRAADWSTSTREGYDDAVTSETLLASIRLGQLVITPGLEKVKDTATRSASVSPRSARKKFYENYPYEPRQTDGWASRLRHADHDEPNRADSESKEADSKPSAEQKRKSLSRGKSIDTEMESGIGLATMSVDLDNDIGRSRKDKYSLRSRAANFIQSVKDKRKMFSKRSSSVDTSVRNSIAKSGFQAAKTGAPTSFEPPTHPGGEKANDAKEAKQAKETKDSKKKAFHRRASSIDLTTLFSVSRSSSMKDRDKAKSAESSTGSQSHSIASSAVGKDRTSSTEDNGNKSKKSAPALPVKKSGKKSLFDG